MEIGVRVEAENLLTGEIRHTNSAYLTFVAMGENGKPSPVPPLILETGVDHRRNREAIERRTVRKEERKRETASAAQPEAGVSPLREVCAVTGPVTATGGSLDEIRALRPQKTRVRDPRTRSHSGEPPPGSGD